MRKLFRQVIPHRFCPRFGEAQIIGIATRAIGMSLNRDASVLAEVGDLRGELINGTQCFGF